MKLFEIFDNLSESFLDILYEMAFSRRDAESRITGLSHSIIEHLIKVLKWEDHLNYEKHLGDIDGWLRQIRIIKLKGNKIPKFNDYHQWMLLDLAPNEETIKLWIKSLNRYHQLKELTSDKEVYLQITEIITNIASDLSKNIDKNIDSYF